MTKTRTPRKKAEGLGDTVEQVLEATGIAKVAKFLMGEDCGCDARKEKLNGLFPYNKPECLTEDEYNYLNESQVLFKESIKPTEQEAILNIYNRVFHVRREPTSCASCLREIIVKMQQVFNEYETE
jgi:hypothetical protein